MGEEKGAGHAIGSVTFQGASNGSTVNPLIVQLDNVTFDTLTSPTNFASPNTLPDIYQAQITLGPGAVSSNLATPLLAANGSNGNVDYRHRQRHSRVSCLHIHLS